MINAQPDWPEERSAVIAAIALDHQEFLGSTLDAIARAGLRGQIILPVDRLDQPSRRATDFCMPRGIGVTAAIADMRRRGVSDAAICHRLGLSPRSLVPERRGSEAW